MYICARTTTKKRSVSTSASSPSGTRHQNKSALAPSEEYRRAAICAAKLNDWEKAATFFEDGAKRTQRIENPERYIGLYADAGFAQFKAGKMLESINSLNLALQNFEKVPQDNTDINYFSLKHRLAHTIRWMVEHGSENDLSALEEPLVGMCSHPEPNEKNFDPS